MSDLIVDKINELKNARKAVMLAHNYQPGEIQDLADFTGDSLGLSIEASKTKADVIVFCGVLFMAETAAILSPEKTVLLPERRVGLACVIHQADQPHGPPFILWLAAYLHLPQRDRIVRGIASHIQNRHVDYVGVGVHPRPHLVAPGNQVGGDRDDKAA